MATLNRQVSSGSGWPIKKENQNQGKTSIQQSSSLDRTINL
jgi:hypothetical protein